MLGWAVMVNALSMAATERLSASKRPHDWLHFRHHPARIKAVSSAARRPAWRYQAQTHFHSLHFNALVMTSVAIFCQVSTGPGQVAQ